MTPADLDALIERLLRCSIRINGELMMEQAAAALVQQRDRIAALEAERDWYTSRADDLVRYLSMKPPQITAVEAVIAELTLRAAKERP